MIRPWLALKISITGAKSLVGGSQNYLNCVTPKGKNAPNQQGGPLWGEIWTVQLRLEKPVQEISINPQSPLLQPENC